MAKLPGSLQKLPASKVIIIAIILFAATGLLWWRAVYSNPRNVFEGMLDNSFRLNGISRTVSQSDEAQSMRQASRLNLTAEPTAVSKAVLKQGSGTTVVTENIGTPQSDYIRYSKIDTDQQNTEGQSPDFSNVVGVWGKNTEAGAADTTDGELFNEMMFGVVPFGRLDAAGRQELLSLIEQEGVYEVDYDTVETTVENGRPLYTYQVGVEAEAYVKLIKRFGELTGVNNLESLDPRTYAGQERLPFIFTVDVWSRQLVGVGSEGQARAETYSSHNANSQVKAPEETVPTTELQTRLQTIQ